MKRTAIIRRRPPKPKGFSSVHVFDRPVMSHLPKRQAWLGNARQTRIKSRSPRKAADDRKYIANKAAHLAEFPVCQYPAGCKCRVGGPVQMDLHHRAGRNGPLLYTRKYFATACRPHHNLAKDKPKESRAIGWVIDVSSAEVRALRQSEILNS